jgi:hypothetical protein
LAKYYPHITIDWFCDANFVDILEQNHYIANVYPVVSKKPHKQIKNFNTGKSSPKASPKPSNNSPSSSPKSVSSTSSGKSDNLLSNSILSKLLKDRRINAGQEYRLSKLKSNSVLDLIKPEDVMDLYVNEKISDKLLNKLLEKVTPKTQIIFPKRK